jgi:hypothetical protein
MKKFLLKHAILWMHCIDLLMRISDQLDFLIYDFSVIYYAILKFQLIYFF